MGLSVTPARLRSIRQGAPKAAAAGAQARVRGVAGVTCGAPFCGRSPQRLLLPPQEPSRPTWLVGAAHPDPMAARGQGAHIPATPHGLVPRPCSGREEEGRARRVLEGA